MSLTQARKTRETDNVLIWTADLLQGDYLCQIYSQAGFKVTLVTGYQALRDSLSALTHLPVLIVIGRFDKLQQLRSLQKLAPLASLLMLTPHQDLNAGLKMLEAGADGYLMQPVQPDELIAESHALLRHSHRILSHFASSHHTSSQRFGPLTLWPAQHMLEHDSRQIVLNANQYKLLSFFCLHANQIVRREQLVQVLSTRQNGRSSRQVDNLVLSLRRVLPKHPDFAIETRYGEGYLFRLK